MVTNLCGRNMTGMFLSCASVKLSFRAIGLDFEKKCANPTIGLQVVHGI